MCVTQGRWIAFPPSYLKFDMSKKKNQRRTKRSSQPEVVEIGPRVFVQKMGNWEMIRSDRNQEQQAALISSLKQFVVDFPLKTKEKIAILEKLLARHNSFELLANLMLVELSINPETYKEPTHHHKDSMVEYAALLCLKHPFSNAGLPFSGDYYQEIVDLLNDITQTTTNYYLFEGVGDEVQPTKLDELHRETITHELMVRSPGYPHHMAETLLALFKPFDSWLLGKFGFTISDALAVERALHDLTNKRFFSKKNELRDLEVEMRAAFNDYLKHGTLVEEKYRSLFERLREVPIRNAKNIIHNLLGMKLFQNLGDTLTFTIQDFGETSGLTADKQPSLKR